MSRIRIVLLAFVAILFLAASASSASTTKSLSLRVYSDGYVVITQTLAVDPKATSVLVPLISPVVSNLVATDQNGSPLSYSFPSGGTNITVYTLGASGATIRYDTDTLTTKNGTVWTLAFASKFNSTVVLPQFSTLGSVSGTPYSINETGTSPEMNLSPGAWKVSYGVPLGITTSTTTGGPGGSTTPGNGAPGGGSGGLSGLQLEVILAVVAVAVLAALGVRWWRKGTIGGVSQDLRPDDLQVLNFIQEKGGKVLEPEIRMRFALPKTSAWRQIKRLERMGYVRVTKIGSQNQIELLKNRNATA